MDDKNKLEQLEEKVNRMRNGEDIENIENIRRRTLEGAIFAGVASTATTGDILKAVAEGGSASYNVAKAPAQKLRVSIDGTDYYLALYNV